MFVMSCYSSELMDPLSTALAFNGISDRRASICGHTKGFYFGIGTSRTGQHMSGSGPL